MKWLVTLQAASENDVPRILAEKIQGLSAIPDEPTQLLWTVDLPCLRKAWASTALRNPKDSSRSKAWI